MIFKLHLFHLEMTKWTFELQRRGGVDEVQCDFEGVQYFLKSLPQNLIVHGSSEGPIPRKSLVECKYSGFLIYPISMYTISSFLSHFPHTPEPYSFWNGNYIEYELDLSWRDSNVQKLKMKRCPNHEHYRQRNPKAQL